MHAAVGEAHTAQQVAVGDAGGREVAVVGGDQLVRGQHRVEVEAGVEGLLLLGVVGGGQAALDDAAGGLDRARGDDALGGAADAHHHVHAGVRAGGGDGAGDVAVQDELHAGAGLADLLDQALVAGAVQHAHGHLGDGLVQGLGHEVHVLLHRQAHVHEVGGLGAHHELVHVEHGRRVEHGAALGHREDGERVVVAHGGQAGAVDRVHGHVHGGAGAVADLLAVEQHGGLVLLALADHHGAVHGHGVHERAHRVHRGAVRLVLVPVAHPGARGDGRRLGHPHQLHGQVAVRDVILVAGLLRGRAGHRCSDPCSRRSVRTGRGVRAALPRSSSYGGGLPRVAQC